MSPSPFRMLCLLNALLLGVSGLAVAQTGTVLLQKAEALDRTNQFEAAEAAYNQASRAFGKAGNSDGQVKALKELAAMDERMAEKYLQQAQAGTPAPAAAAARPVAMAAPQPRSVAAPARPVAAAARTGAAPVTVAPSPPPGRLAGSPAVRRPAAAAGPAPLAGRTTGGRPVGLFYYVGGYNYDITRTYYFTPAGQVYVEPTDFSAAGLAALDASARGTFAISGKQMTIKWANGQSTECGNYHYDPTGFGCQGSYVCVEPVGNAQRLVGTFEGRNAAQSLDASSLAVFRTLNLKADGTFTRDNFVASHSEAHHSDDSRFVTDASSTAAQQAGRWSVNGWFLTLTDASGTARGVAYRIRWDEKTDKTGRFRFSNTSYERTK